MQLQDLSFIRLADGKERAKFDCGDEDLNDFIHNDAWNYQKQLLTVTWLFEDIQENIIAFFSVSNDSLKDQDYEKWNNLSRKISNRKRRKDYPSVKIGRLGVSMEAKGQNIGSQIMLFIKSWFCYENKTGCRFLLVDAYNKPEVLRFYEKNEFILLTEKDSIKKTRLMYFDLIRMMPK
jgi:predicted GNAT family N-acyltransferase